jgi:tetratricopeptide (TPR) repeat protein
VIDTAIAYTYILTVRDTQKGVKFARKAHKIYKDEWTYQVLIYAYIKDKKFTKALNLAKEAIKRFHDYKYADFKLCICIVQCHMGLMRVAFKNMVEIYSLEFNNGILELLFHSYYVKLLQYFGRFEDARSVCDEYLEKFPDNNELSNMSRNLFLYFITQNNNPLSEL